MQAMILNEAAQDLLNVMDRVNNKHEPLMVTYERCKSVVIMSLDDFNAWQETTYFTSSSANAKNLLETAKEIHTHTVRRKPSSKIAGKGKILGDIMTPVVAIEEWNVLV
ncbi:type II toxin-antitoxin system prevent-host-death family antitoxin [Candidatus Parabeggiatoa sp. HSG14]|uniref:type II toxin-antitoxin system Phd/YefM family antitoxin n=1 Tax=Candidatus Parabeggiatoa sp. HSG14 TaxID=3055593 RepID=UPI0025A85F30|nr:type II toxin-antitoxin system prevent-host-death family antitoxin [Thiotrichales bacterium HSG14]